MYQGTSELFNEKIKASSRTFRARLVNTSDSTDVIEKGFRKLTIAQISNEDKRSLSIGGITASELNVEIDNLSGVITGKEFDVQIGLLLDDEQNTYEWVTIGKFTAQKPTIKNNVTSFTAFDRFVSRLGGLYVSRLTYPASGKAILNEIATMSGVVINTDGLTDIMFPQKTVINSSGENVSANPFDGFTYREAISYVAMAYGKFATVNRNGEVDLRWYTDTNYRVEKNMSYDDISVADTEFSVEYLNVTVNNDRNNPLIKGEGLTGISIGTPIFTTEMLNHAYSQVSGFKYIPTTLSFKGDPRIDLGDIVTVVKYDNTEVKVPIMSLDFDFDGGLICEIGSYGDTEQSEKAYATSPNANKYDRMYTELLLLNQAIANKVTAEYVEAHYVATKELDTVQANITQAVIKDLNTEFITAEQADLKYANIELTNIDVANVGRLLADVGLITNMVIKDGHVTGVLDSVTINANNIISGTLTTDRLVIRGTDKSIVYELNNISGALQAKEVDTLNGEIITPRTINADRIIANSITSGELNVNEIFANSAIIKKIFSEDVEATGTITGATLKGAYAEITEGSIGGFTLTDKLTATGTAYLPPTLSDFNIIKNAMANGTIGSLYSQNIWYDINGDGKTDVYDFGYMRNMILGKSEYKDYAHKKLSTVTIEISPNSMDKSIRIYGINAWGSLVETYIGIDEVATNSIKANSYISVKGDTWNDDGVQTVGDVIAGYGTNNQVSLQSLIHNFLPLTGGTVTGASTFSKLLTTSEGSIIAGQAKEANWGTAGYVVIAKIVVKQTYMSNSTLMLTLSSFNYRHRAEGKIFVKFTNSGTVSSTTVSELSTYGTPAISYVLTQNTSANTATLEIIAQKAAYESFAITNMSTSSHFRYRVDMTFPMTFETSLRSGANAAKSYNPWTITGSVTGTSASVALNAGSSYLFTVSTTLSTEAAFMVLAKTNGAFNLVKLYSAGSMNASLSGTTLTISAGSSTTINYKYIELK